MKTNLKNILGLATLSMTLLTTVVPTWAGSVSTPEVFISDRGGIPYAQGSMVGARYSADNNQFIGCSIRVPPNQPLGIECLALDSASHYLPCLSDDPKHVEAVQAMTDSSYIYFEVDRTRRTTCSVVAITDGSRLLK